MVACAVKLSPPIRAFRRMTSCGCPNPRRKAHRSRSPNPVWRATIFDRVAALFHGWTARTRMHMNHGRGELMSRPVSTRRGGRPLRPTVLLVPFGPRAAHVVPFGAIVVEQRFG